MSSASGGYGDGDIYESETFGRVLSISIGGLAEDDDAQFHMRVSIIDGIPAAIRAAGRNGAPIDVDEMLSFPDRRGEAIIIRGRFFICGVDRRDDNNGRTISMLELVAQRREIQLRRADYASEQLRRAIRTARREVAS